MEREGRGGGGGGVRPRKWWEHYYASSNQVVMKIGVDKINEGLVGRQAVM